MALYSLGAHDTNGSTPRKPTRNPSKKIGEPNLVKCLRYEGKKVPYKGDDNLKLNHYLKQQFLTYELLDQSSTQLKGEKLTLALALSKTFLKFEEM